MEFAKTRFAEIQDVIVSCEYGYNTGTAYFDDIQLIRTAVERNLTAEDFAVIPDDPTSDTTASADEAPEAEPFEEWLDSFGNALTETTFTDGEFGTLYRAFGYDTTGNNLVSETDTRGNVTAYTVDAVTSRNEEITDRCGNKTVYEYDESGRTTKMTAKDAAGVMLSNVGYTYDAFDNLTEITRGDGMKYALAYSAHRDIGSIGIDGRSTPLMSYAYKQGSGRLKQVTYANGDTMKLTYNSIGQAVAEKWYDAAQTLIADYRYAYDGTGNLIRSVDILAAKEYTYTYEDGKIIRAAESTLTFGENLVVIGKTLLYSVWYTYDKDDVLICKRFVEPDNTSRMVYYETPEGGNPVVKMEINGKLVQSHSKNDAFGRKEFDELQIGTGFVSRRFEYLAGEVTDQHVAHQKLKSSPTSQLVDRIVLSDGRTISYEYDAEERITKVTDSVEGTTLYTYDALGELEHEIRDNTVVNCMTYDRYGNIRTKNGKLYEYDAVWKDLLTSYDGQPITYDAQGNPTAYLGHTLAWEKGRQLRSFDSNSYTYNANGIRTAKTVGGVKHEYRLDGANILKEVWGENTLIPLYDNEDAVCGILYNNVPYYFLKNLQGDIIEIVDANAEVVARYSYDAWGVPTIVSDTSGCSIATINPFHYRGYYYDAEIGMYYLQSRYYDPVVGRFINADDAQVLAPSISTLEFNLFCYCENNPTNETDYSGSLIGKIVEKILLGILKGFVSQLCADVITFLYKVIFVNKNSTFMMSSLNDYLKTIAECVVAELLSLASKAEFYLKLICLIVKYSPKILNNRMSGNDWLKLTISVISLIVGKTISKNLSKKQNNQLSQLRKFRKKNSRNLSLKAKKRSIKLSYKSKGVKVQIGIDISEYVLLLFFDLLAI